MDMDPSPLSPRIIQAPPDHSLLCTPVLALHCYLHKSPLNCTLALYTVYCSEFYSPSPALYVTIEPPESHFTVDWSQGAHTPKHNAACEHKTLPGHAVHLCFTLDSDCGTHQ